MANILSEATFETAIVDHLTANGYLEGRANAFDPVKGYFPAYVLAFLKESQTREWERLEKVHGAQIEAKLLARLEKELELNGALGVLRRGFVDYGVRFRLAFFRPETGLNTETLEQYASNRLHVTRQVHFSERFPHKSIDLVVSLNGLPLLTIELKNQFTGQNTHHAQTQYRFDRDPREPIFEFKKRALVHFAVDTDEVYMTTRLEGEKTRYLPFNKGNEGGSGNPLNPAGYRSAYLWEEVLEKHSLLDVVNRFLHIETEEIRDKVTNKIVRTKEAIIFPRYHQLSAVRALVADSKEKGVGQNYLIQHSAGSGKSNTIAWLAYHLSSLHSYEDQLIFDSIIVVTDRKVLDRQLQTTIYQFEQVPGLVEKIDKNAEQLRNAIQMGKAIIITTLQKFPFVAEKMAEMPGRKYAVIIDEAHSSQGGEASRKMKEVLSVSDLETAEKEDADYLEPDETEDLVLKSMRARGRQANISFFAFTATPKSKTLEVFGRPDASGRPRPFHLYSMRQAIEEGFILNVLQNYTTYALYFRLSKQIEDDPELNKKKAAIAIGRFVSLHPHNLAQKTEIIIEHFRQVVSKKIGGLAKAMVVTGSRLHAVRYFQQFQLYIREKGYTDIKTLVAFSGKVIASPDFLEGITEVELNKIGEKELPEKFATPEYQILLVAEKYQTGFDQPLLHTMYVDKKLSGVKAVQTLSRLNRCHPGKEDTFVLDFVNDRQTILDSFQPYFEETTVEPATDPNLLYDLKNRLDSFRLYLPEEIEGLAISFFVPQLTKNQQAKLNRWVDPAVDRFKALEDEDRQDLFKKMLQQWLSLYSFLSQIVPFQDAELEKFYAYGRLLVTKLPKKEISERLKVHDEVALEYYRLEKVAEGSILMEPQTIYGLPGQTETGIKRAAEEHDKLSSIIGMLNDRFGTEFTEADRLFFDQIVAQALEDEVLMKQAQINTMDNFRYGFHDRIKELMVDRMEQNSEIVSRVLSNKAFSRLVLEWALKEVWGRIKR